LLVRSDYWKTAPQRIDVLVHMCHFISGTVLSPELDQHNIGHLELARLSQAAGAPAPARLE